MKSGQSGTKQSHADFEALYKRHSREVWALVYARWLNADLAMDIVQETYLRFWKQSESGEQIVNPRAWLLRVARNLAEDHGKSSFRRNGTHPPEIMNGVRAQVATPLEQMEREETFARLRGALARLSPSDREVLTYRYALDYEAERIADLLSVSITAVHMRLSRARQRLGEHLTAEGVIQAS
jgi:RNA polymerase sigma-70 factor (ECF subfamily)